MSSERRASPAPHACPNSGSCPLFPLFSRPGFLRVWQIHYCEADYSKCERFKLGREGKPVPQTMLPNGQSLTALGRELVKDEKK
jgi:hypothetical protein